jgi:hypothetical protein
MGTEPRGLQLLSVARTCAELRCWTLKGGAGSPLNFIALF